MPVWPGILRLAGHGGQVLTSAATHVFMAACRGVRRVPAAPVPHKIHEPAVSTGLRLTTPVFAGIAEKTDGGSSALLCDINDD